MKKIMDDKNSITLAKGKSVNPHFSGIGRYLPVFGLGIMVGIPALNLYKSESHDATNHLFAAAPLQGIKKGNPEDNNLTLDSLMRRSADELARLDLARMNLICSKIYVHGLQFTV
jgi:hypothetical protein